MAFVTRKFARPWHSNYPNKRKQIIIDRLAKYSGEDARNPIAYAGPDWCGEEWSGGVPITFFPNWHAQRSRPRPARTD
jgi:monoamine oxidase